MTEYRRVPMNSDKPHRCPECHAVCFRADRRDRNVPLLAGHRERLVHASCDACQVTWRMPPRGA